MKVGPHKLSVERLRPIYGHLFGLLCVGTFTRMSVPLSIGSNLLSALNSKNRAVRRAKRLMRFPETEKAECGEKSALQVTARVASESFVYRKREGGRGGYEKVRVPSLSSPFPPPQFSSADSCGRALEL